MRSLVLRGTPWGGFSTSSCCPAGKGLLLFGIAQSGCVCGVQFSPVLDFLCARRIELARTRRRIAAHAAG